MLIIIIVFNNITNKHPFKHKLHYAKLNNVIIVI